MAALKLVPVDEGFPTLEIEGDRATIGRTAGVDHIVNDPSVSRQHAIFENRSGVWTVTDKGSANGTFVDGQRVVTAEVREGQEVRFGARVFRVRIDWAEMATALLPEGAFPPPSPTPPRPVGTAPPLPPRPVPPRAEPGLAPWPGPPPALMGLAASGGVPPSATPSAAGPTGMAQAAFVSGLLSIFLCPAPVAIILGILGILDVKRAPGRTGLGRSIFGLCAGLVGSLALGAALVSGVLSEARRTSSTPAPRTTPAPGLPAPASPLAGGVVITGKDGKMRIAAPADWRAEKDLNPNADLQACDPPQQVCVMVFEDDKATTGPITLARFSRFTRGQVLKKLRNSSEGAEVALQIGGYPALQYELRGQTDRFDLVYLHTSVDTPGHLYQVMGWTSSALYPQEKAALSSIADSFRP